MNEYFPKTYTVIFQLSVVPSYRLKFFSRINSELSEICNVKVISSVHSLDKQVLSDKSLKILELQNVVALPYGFFWQRGFVREVLTSDFLIVDKNPRSLNSWFNLLIRRISGRKTYTWGHSKSRTNDTRLSRFVHHIMNLLASGIFVYTNEESANISVNRKKVHIAPNSIMYQSECIVNEISTRNNIIFSGRIEKSKELEKLIRAFGNTMLSRNGTKLIIVGQGSYLKDLQGLVNELGYSNQIELPGEIWDFEGLRKVYANARIAIGTGYGGLNVTQANCFGVPIVLDKFGRHSPEIALRKFNGVVMADFTSIDDMSRAIEIFFEALDWNVEQRKELASKVSRVYCISNMARPFEIEIRKQIGTKSAN